MTIKVLIACSGLEFAFHPEQVIETASDELCADLVKHGIAEYVDGPVETAVVSEPDSVETATASENEGVETATTTDPDSETASTPATDPTKTTVAPTKPKRNRNTPPA